MKTIRTYTELMKLATFEERFEYLKLDGTVGEDTFGHSRYLNQTYYKSREWRQIRNSLIIRDGGLELGIDGMPIIGRIHVHHMNPITKDDIINQTDYLTNPEYLICMSADLHKAIHYGNVNAISSRQPIIRSKNDTCPWKD